MFLGKQTQPILALFVDIFSGGKSLKGGRQVTPISITFFSKNVFRTGGGRKSGNFLENEIIVLILLIVLIFIHSSFVILHP